MQRPACVIGIVVAMVLGAPVVAEDFLVPSQFPTIQSAINAAPNGGRICVEGGVYVEQIDSLGKELIIIGNVFPQTILRPPAGAPGAVVTVSPGGQLTLSTFQIQDGRGAFGGGVAVLPGADTRLTNVDIDNCVADNGGGVAIGAGAHAWLDSVRIDECTAEFYGGGVACFGGTLNPDFLRVEDSIAGLDGGGIYLEDAIVGEFGFLSSARRCTSQGNGGGLAAIDTSWEDAFSFSFTDNTAAGHGSGAYLDGSSALFSFGEFVSNAPAGVGHGGAIAAVNGAEVTASSVDFIGNTASEGGAIWADNASVSVAYAWFEANEASGDGGAIHATHFNAVTNVQVFASTFTHNTGENGGAVALVPRSFIGSTTVGLYNTEISFNESTTPSGVGGVAQLDPIFASSSLFVLGCTMTENQGGLVGGIKASSGVTRVDNSIVWDNPPVDTDLHAGASATHSIFPEFASVSGSGSFSADPQLIADAFDNGQIYHRIAISSPATDRGHATFLALDAMDLDNDGVTLEVAPGSVGSTIRQFDDPFAPNLGVGAPPPDIGSYELTRCSAADLEPSYFVLDFTDVIAFLAAWSAMDPLADLSAPTGVWDFTDLIAFLTAFGAGCP